eukprot:7405552-Pyramimonas_sp.AAC.1
MRPAPRREQHFENASENPFPGNPVCKKQCAGVCRIFPGRHQGKWESIFILCTYRRRRNAGT